MPRNVSSTRIIRARSWITPRHCKSSDFGNAPRRHIPPTSSNTVPSSRSIFRTMSISLLIKGESGSTLTLTSKQ